MLLCFSKRAPESNDAVLVVANMDVHNAQAGWVDLDRPEPVAARPGRADGAPVQLHDLLSDARYFSEGRRIFVRLDPGSAPAHIFRVRHRARTEHDFDYFL
jgi:starch synthase (maltosyl-transferring)